jgi:F0F1-type ATP synthase membrane subunit a
MFHTLTQYVKADEEELKRFMELSLRLAGVLAAAILVFLLLYFFVASLDVPVIHPHAHI